MKAVLCLVLLGLLAAAQAGVPDPTVFLQALGVHDKYPPWNRISSWSDGFLSNCCASKGTNGAPCWEDYCVNGYGMKWG